MQYTHSQPSIPGLIPLIPHPRPLPTRVPLNRRPKLMLDMPTLIRATVCRTRRLNTQVAERALQIMPAGPKVAQIVAVAGKFAVAPGAEVGDEIAVPAATDRRDEGGGAGFGLDHGQREFGAFAPGFFPFGAEVDGAGYEVVR
jgi:hypothetical protein